MQEIKVSFSFINEKGVKRTVNVYVDKGTYAILPKLKEEDRVNYLKDLYHDQEREKNYHRKTFAFSKYTNSEESSYDPEDVNQNLETSVINELFLKQVLDYLPIKDRQYITLFYIEGYTKTDIATKLNVTRKTVQTNLDRIIEELRMHFNK